MIKYYNAVVIGLLAGHLFAEDWQAIIFVGAWAVGQHILIQRAKADVLRKVIKIRLDGHE